MKKRTVGWKLSHDRNDLFIGEEFDLADSGNDRVPDVSRHRRSSNHPTTATVPAQTSGHVCIHRGDLGVGEFRRRR